MSHSIMRDFEYRVLSSAYFFALYYYWRVREITPYIGDYPVPARECDVQKFFVHKNESWLVIW
jgi:hypothetical protein